MNTAAPPLNPCPIPLLSLCPTSTLLLPISSPPSVPCPPHCSTSFLPASPSHHLSLPHPYSCPSLTCFMHLLLIPCLPHPYPFHALHQWQRSHSFSAPPLPDSCCIPACLAPSCLPCIRWQRPHSFHQNGGLWVAAATPGGKGLLAVWTGEWGVKIQG